jgi:hypothetical protein
MSSRKSRSHAEWCELIAEQETGELAIKAFCVQRSLSEPSFYYQKNKRNQYRREPAGFEELRARTTCSIFLKPASWNGQIEVQQGFDPACLRALLDVLG